MKQLANKPLFMAALLTVPLWVVFGNFLVGAMVALFAAFFIAMCHSLYLVKRDGADAGKARPAPSRKRRK